jgi:hypothetical protein
MKVGGYGVLDNETCFSAFNLLWPAGFHGDIYTCVNG